MIETCVPPGVTLLGGEMLQWSDRESGRPPVDGGPLVELVRTTLVQGSRVLVVGVHAVPVLEAVVARAGSVTHVLRSMPDAGALADRFSDVPGVTIACGSLERIAGGPFDAIVALDGLDRVLSADGVTLSWRDRLRHLTGLLADDGVLLVAQENELGLHRLVGMTEPEAARDDSEWWPAHGVDPTRPASPASLGDELARCGLSVAASYAAYPTPELPAVLVPGEGGAEVPGETLATVLTSACAAGLGGQPLVADPRWVARTVVRGGSTGQLAPAWIAVCGPAVAPPGMLVGDGQAGWAVTCELRQEGQETWRWVRSGPAVVSADDLSRDPAMLTGQLPVGRTLEELLRSACVRADLPGVRELLRSYAGWLGKNATDGELGGALAFATADNVVLDEAGWALADPSWSWSGPVSSEEVLARSLRRFVVGLITGGQMHPWPSFLGATRLCETLHAMADHPVSPEAIERGVTLEAEIAGLMAGVPASELVAAIREPQLAPSALSAHRTLVSAHAKVCDDLRAARERAEWSESAVVRWRNAADTAKREKKKTLRTLTKVQCERKRLKRALAKARGTWGYRFGRSIKIKKKRILRLLKRS